MDQQHLWSLHKFMDFLKTSELICWITGIKWNKLSCSVSSSREGQVTGPRSYVRQKGLMPCPSDSPNL